MTTGFLALKKIIQLVLPAACLGLLTSGCQTYKSKNTVITEWQRGNLTNAVAIATKKADKNANNKDAIVWRLEQAATLRAEGKWEKSNQAFDQAQEKIDDYAQKAKVRLAQETGALLSNQDNLDYEGRAYDGIMLNTYKALNYLALGDTEKARPELIRAYQRQQDAVVDNQKHIEKVQKEAEESKDKKAIEKAENDPKFQLQMKNATVDIQEVKGYADYVNPFTVYLDGLYFLANSTGTSDLERARKSLERVAGFDPDNRYVKEDLATAEAVLGGKTLLPTTYVIFETGCAPVRDEVRIDIPIVFSKVSYVGAAFPTLKPQGNFLSSLTVLANGTNYSTETVASMDGIITQDFKNEQPVVITKTIAAAVVKAAAAYAVNDTARRQDPLVGLFSQIATAAYQFAVNIADTRTWSTLPKEFQVCRFPTPPDGRIELSAANGIKLPVTLSAGGETKVELTSGSTQASLNAVGLIHVVYVKSITAGTPLLVSQFKLK
jgi:hypothetical protein